jgi:branched-chain amino acid transport system substrate-binding protein
MKVGLLYPRSKAHPFLAADFMDGVKAFLAHKELKDKIEIISASIGFGGDEKEAYVQAEKLLMIEDADLLVAFIDLRILALLEPLVFASGKLFIVVNPGANYPQNWVPQPNMIYLTLQHAFLCWLTGKQAGIKPSASAVVASTFYDCGYLHVAAMVKAFAKTGGTVVYNYINNNLYNESFEISALTNFLDENEQTNNLLCLFDALPGSLFYDRLNKYNHTKPLQLFVSPMMLEPQAIEKLDKKRNYAITGFSHWPGAETNNESKILSDAFTKQCKRKVSSFALMGWETGLLLEKINEHGKEDIKNGAQLKETLSGITLQSPRGELLLDAETNYYTAPVFRCTIQSNEVQPQLQQESHLADEWKAFVNEPSGEFSSGWLNTYLCY